jgi:hypothetical protein
LLNFDEAKMQVKIKVKKWKGFLAKFCGRWQGLPFALILAFHHKDIDVQFIIIENRKVSDVFYS